MDKDGGMMDTNERRTPGEGQIIYNRTKRKREGKKEREIKEEEKVKFD